MASDIGAMDKAYSFFKGSCDVDLGPAMNTSDIGIHTASMGGIWQAAIYGFAGLRMQEDVLRISPRLPEAWRAMSFAVIWQGQRLEMAIQTNRVQVRNTGHKAVCLKVCGVDLVLEGNEQVCRDS